MMFRQLIVAVFALTLTLGGVTALAPSTAEAHCGKCGSGTHAPKDKTAPKDKKGCGCQKKSKAECAKCKKEGKACDCDKKPTAKDCAKCDKAKSCDCPHKKSGKDRSNCSKGGKKG